MHVDINAYLVIIYFNIKKITGIVTLDILKVRFLNCYRDMCTIRNKSMQRRLRLIKNKILQLFLNHNNNESIYQFQHM